MLRISITMNPAMILNKIRKSVYYFVDDYTFVSHCIAASVQLHVCSSTLTQNDEINNESAGSRPFISTGRRCIFSVWYPRCRLTYIVSRLELSIVGKRPLRVSNGITFPRKLTPDILNMQSAFHDLLFTDIGP